MFKDSIPGLEKLFENDLERPAVVLVRGTPGAGKTNFSYQMMANYLTNHPTEKGVYITLEEPREQIIETMKNMGVETPKNMNVLGLGYFKTEFHDGLSIKAAATIALVSPDVAEEFATDEKVLLLDLLKLIFYRFKEDFGEDFSIVCIDSLSALYTIIPQVNLMRIKMYHFFKYLKKLGIYTFITKEIKVLRPGKEEYLSNGIIDLDKDMVKGKYTVRYIKIAKMRNCDHSLEPVLLSFPGTRYAEKNQRGLKVGTTLLSIDEKKMKEVIIPLLAAKPLTPKDIEGEGLLRGSIPGFRVFFDKKGGDIKKPPYSILITGAAGSGKTILAYQFMGTYLKLHPREAGLYLSLEEETDTQTKNLENLDIDVPEDERFSLKSLENYRDSLGEELEKGNVAGWTKKKYTKATLQKMNAEEMLAVLDAEAPEPPKYDEFILDLIDSEIKYYEKKGYKLTIICIDSIQALEELMFRKMKNPNQTLFNFSMELKERKLYSLILGEEDIHYEKDEMKLHESLNDGWIMLRAEKSDEGVRRYIRVPKMRGVPHTLDRRNYKIVKADRSKGIPGGILIGAEV